MLKRFEDFVSGISICYKYIQRIKAMEMNEIEPGLKGTHVMFLFYLNRHPEGLTSGRLSELCQEDKAAVSRTLGELMDRGYVLQADNGAKRYRALNMLSETGRALAQKVEQVIPLWVCNGGDGLSEEERSAFYRSLGIISENLKGKYSEKSN